jgi:hypothetical protein
MIRRALIRIHPFHLPLPFCLLLLYSLDPAAAAALPCSLYSGTGFDPCCHGLAKLYEFGPNVSDDVGAYGDNNVSFNVSWLNTTSNTTTFKFFEKAYTTIFVNTNGWLTFSVADAERSSVYSATAVGSQTALYSTCVPAPSTTRCPTFLRAGHRDIWVRLVSCHQRNDIGVRQRCAVPPRAIAYCLLGVLHNPPTAVQLLSALCTTAPP